MAQESPWEVVVLVLQWALVTTLCSVVVRRDERRLDEERLARAWPPASRDAALIGLSLLGSPLLAMLGVWFHFFRTRRWSPVGFLVGMGWTFAIMAANVVFVVALAWALGLPLE
jgi:hypothetical protein